MSGRHRHTGPGITRRALAGTVPVLGVAGAATGLALTSGAAFSPMPDSGPAQDAVVPAAAGTAPAVRTEVPGRADRAVSAVSAATDATRSQDARARAQEQRSVTAVVEQIRADARDREQTARAQGDAELDAFRDQQARQEQQQAEGYPSAPAEPGECDLSGMPRLSPFAGSDEIVNRDCGLTGARGEDRSQDPWIDGQLLDD